VNGRKSEDQFIVLNTLVITMQLHCKGLAYNNLIRMNIEH